MARRNLTDAARAAAAPTIQVLALGTLALCEAEQGNLPLSSRLAAGAMHVVIDRGLQAMPQPIFAFTAYGASLTGGRATPTALDDASRHHGSPAGRAAHTLNEITPVKTTSDREGQVADANSGEVRSMKLISVVLA